MKPRIATLLRYAAVALLAAACAACADRSSDSPAQPAAAQAPAAAPPAPARASAPTHPLVRAARAQVGVVRYYDPAYVRLDYPGGDVAADRGVCTDVVIRALRAQGLDLQQAVHEDMRANFARYPQSWGARGTDRSIDHRRVPNLRRWFERQGWQQTVSDRAVDYRPGDLVTWDLGGGTPHIGIVSDRKGWRGNPLILHNIARGTEEGDLLFAYEITGHYRPMLERALASTP
ncbi:DUF1287 domain-containing protein [Lysobacter sp. cf310]|uniref:DUF1287 domain-containing protein n=1 Tax=Lysobacter sp. cf310 TaxID=1761790 RepID=UPI0008E07F13|nr:DUF1287 domain-containing protein [Lysobacter sp. cf310]SFL27246.1 hypothetical protein SAMN04487938_3952 [Lysobacter sp. cf310]